MCVQVIALVCVAFGIFLMTGFSRLVNTHLEPQLKKVNGKYNVRKFFHTRSDALPRTQTESGSNQLQPYCHNALCGQTDRRPTDPQIINGQMVQANVP